MGNIFSNSEGRKKFVNSVKSMTTKRDTMEKESLQNVLTTSRIALQQLERFGEAFVEQYFNTDLHSHHIAWMEHNYDWFISYQDVPKRLNETVSNPYLSALDTNSTLVKLKQLFRKAKLGLQMVMEDLYGRQDRQMGDEFLLSMEKIEGVITELQIAIQERNISDVTDELDSSFIPEEVKTLGGSSFGSFRNWFIYRDSRNLLEFSISVLENILGN